MSDYKNVLKKCADMGIDLWTENGKLKYKASTNTLSQDILRELLVMGSLNDNCMPISVLLDTAKIFKAKLIIYQEHCHDMMLDPAWEIVAEDILGFILV